LPSDASANVNGKAGRRVVNQLTLTSMKPGANPDSALPDGVDDGKRTPDRARRAVEDG
jgi:hypothetical protein